MSITVCMQLRCWNAGGCMISVKFVTQVAEMSLYHMGLIASPWSWLKLLCFLMCRASFSIPYVREVSEKIKRICSKVGIRIMFRSGRTLRSLLTKVKPRTDPTDATGVVYRISCMDCDRSYIGKTCRTLNVRLKEHQCCCRNLESQKLAVAQHAIEEDHRIHWSKSTVIDKEQ